MRLRLPVVLLTAFALAAPGAMVDAKDKGNKNKDKDKKEQRSDDRRHDDDRDDRDRRNDDRDGKMTICHIPPGNRAARHTISVSDSAWAAHQGHGDTRGACGHGTNNHHRRFNDLDTNNDGVISTDEWRGDRAIFERLDRTPNDGVLSREEFSRR